jgi:hypothetical protein
MAAKSFMSARRPSCDNLIERWPALRISPSLKTQRLRGDVACTSWPVGSERHLPDTNSRDPAPIAWEYDRKLAPRGRDIFRTSGRLDHLLDFRQRVDAQAADTAVHHCTDALEVRSNRRGHARMADISPDNRLSAEFAAFRHDRAMEGNVDDQAWLLHAQRPKPGMISRRR